MTIWAPFEKYGDDNFTDQNGVEYDMGLLNVDEFYVNFIGDGMKLLKVHRDCVECPFQEIDLDIKGNTKFKYQTKLNDNTTCTFNDNFGEFGVYNVYTNNCTVEETREHVNIYFPIFMVCLIYTGVGLLIYGATKWLPQFFEEEKNNGNQKKRMKSLDTFRGLTILMMIFANFGGGGYYYMEHAPWNGLHGADIIFPWFIWIMGAVIPITLPSKLKQGNKKAIIQDTLKRSIKLFCLGIFLNSGNNLYTLRIMAVLQRFGIAYLAVTIILMFLLDTDTNKYQTGYAAWFKDILTLSKAWAVAIIILIIHCLIIFLVHAINCPSGYLGPGGLHKNSEYFGCVGGATGFLDRSILGTFHNYQYPTIAEVFETNAPFDPEGLIGCLTTIFHVFIGVQAGNIYVTYKNEDNAHFKILVRWLSWAVGTGLLGGLLCGFSKEDGIIPVNKNLWSLSFVLVTSCFAFAVLSLFYFLIDQKNWWSGRPLLFAGMNAIVLYAGHALTDGHFPVRITYTNPNDVHMNLTGKTHFGALLSDTFGASVWLFISYIMYRKKIFVTL